MFWRKHCLASAELSHGGGNPHVIIVDGADLREYNEVPWTLPAGEGLFAAVHADLQIASPRDASRLLSPRVIGEDAPCKDGVMLAKDVDDYFLPADDELESYSQVSTRVASS